MPPIAWSVAELLAAAAPNTVTSRQIGSRLFPDAADPGREVRELLQRYWLPLGFDLYRRHGKVLIAHGTGFRLTDDPEDLAHYTATLKSRARHVIERLIAHATLLELTPWADAAPHASTLLRLQRHLTTVH